MSNDKGFVFKDEMGRSYKCKNIEGQDWLLYYNEVYKCWTTLRPVTPQEIEKFKKHKV